jgi:hypothetical protein
MNLSGWFTTAVDSMLEQLRHAPRLSHALKQGGGRAVHLAVCVEPFLSFLLEGTKTIESRFSSTRVPPYRVAEEGDVILLKAASGPIVGAAALGEVTSFGCLDQKKIADLRSRFDSELRGDVPGFWEARHASRYATLLRVQEVASFRVPVACPKSDRRGWVVLQSRQSQLDLFS